MTKRYIAVSIILLVCFLSVSYCEVYYIGPNKLLDDADNHLTLSQFVNNSSDYLRNDTQLTFIPGNYSLEFTLLVENIHSFTLSVKPLLASRAIIICNHNATFEFRKIDVVIVGDLDFVGCFENYVMSVGQFQMEHSKFYSEGLVNSTVLTIDESIATLDRVAFISTVRGSVQKSAAYRNLSGSCLSLLPDRTTIILSWKSNTVITQSWFEGNNVGLGTIIENHDSDITILNTTFTRNVATIILYSTSSQGNTTSIYESNFIKNVGAVACSLASNMLISGSIFINNSAPIVMIYVTDFNDERILQILDSESTLGMIISHSAFIGNSAPHSVVNTNGTVITIVNHSKFTNNIGGIIMNTWNGSTADISHSEFVDNVGSLTSSLNSASVSTGTLILFYGDQISVSHCEFINNRMDRGVIFIRYYVSANNLTITKNTFIDNRTAYDVFISSDCKPGLSSSFGSPRARCIECPRNHLVIVTLVYTAAGIAIIIFMLALNMTVAIGTLNGIHFYANIVAANADTYFFRFLSRASFVKLFISWLNLDIGFDVCVFDGLQPQFKGLIQLLFPAYIILLVIIVIVASECSSKFTKVISKGNPVAVLATMTLLSYAIFLNAILGSINFQYFQLAYMAHAMLILQEKKEEFQSLYKKVIGQKFIIHF